jgi:serine/threonine-protein kinase
MGEVYLARQLSLDRSVAFKVLRPDLLINPISIRRFEAEAGAAAKINHPNIVHIYQLGKIDDLRYIAMEYVAGTNLGDYLQKKGRLDLSVALSIMKQVGQAVEAAGELGLVHRDLKPENLLLTRKGQVKVADFGLCRFQGNQAIQLTHQGVALGTPLYMSPEQVQGEEVDTRSDLYSLGVTFYTMLAGRPPFEADTPLALALKHVREAPPDLRTWRQDLPPELVALVMKLLAKNPDDRYQSATEMLKDLALIRLNLLGGVPTQSIGPDSAALDPSRRIEVGAPASRSQTIATIPLAAPRWWTMARWTVAAVLAVLLGLLLGAKSRPVNLLSSTSPRPAGPLGLWLVPSWRTVKPLGSAERQYRYAQLFAPPEQLEAAWMAVPGYFPDDRTWGFQAYIQFARQLFRSRDHRALRSLAESLAVSENPGDQELVRVAHAGAAALRGDESFVGEFSALNFALMDPALVELGLEIVSYPTRESASPNALRRIKIRDDLLNVLQVVLPEPMNPARPR